MGMGTCVRHSEVSNVEPMWSIWQSLFIPFVSACDLVDDFKFIPRDNRYVCSASLDMDVHSCI